MNKTTLSDDFNHITLKSFSFLLHKSFERNIMRKLLFATIATYTIISLTACQNRGIEKSNSTSTPTNIVVKDSLLTPELLLQIPRVGNVSVSPNGKEILFTVTKVNIDKNKGDSELYTMATSGGNPTCIKDASHSINTIKWGVNSNNIYYLSDINGVNQLFKMDSKGNNAQQLTFGSIEIVDYKLSPDESAIILITPVQIKPLPQERHPDMPKANFRVEEDVMYRHWDEWEDGKFNHIILASLKEDKINLTDNDVKNNKNCIDILHNEPFDSPVKPFGDIEEITWTPDGSKIIYTCKKLEGKRYALSTNSDLYIYDINSKTTSNLTHGMMGYDRNPAISPDGTLLAWESMERDGYEADKNRLFIMDLKSGTKVDYTLGFDQNVANLNWDIDNRTIYFTSGIQATEQIYALNTTSKVITKITNGQHDYNSIYLEENNIIGTKTSMSSPSEIYSIDKNSGNEKRLTYFTDEVLSKIKMGKVEKRWIKTTDGKEMLTWVIYPPNFDPTKKYPTLLYCQGGPQDAVSQFWSIRWNFQLMAANNYIVVAPNRRGLPSFGQAWNEQISGDYGGQNMLDYFSAIDLIAKEPFVDSSNLGAIGASYGGFSIYWIAGNHNNRFKAFISHCGIFNLEQMYSTTEESFFTNFDLKGAYWDTQNSAAQKSYSFSPHKFVKNWDTPILVIHGAQDFRIPEEQGMGAFNSAILKGVPARFLYFPNENHWVLSPQNGVVWHREFYSWLDKWLKK